MLWVERALGRGSRVVASRRMTGGVTSVFRALRVVAPLMAAAFDPDGPLHETYAVAIVHRGRLGDAAEMLRQVVGKLECSGSQAHRAGEERSWVA